MNEFVQSACPAGVEYMVKAMKSANKAAVAEQKTMAFKAIGSTPDGIIVGVGAACGSPNKLDLDGEFFDQADLKRMASSFCASKSRTFKANHKDEIDCDLVASWAGAPIIREGGRLRTLKADESLSDGMNVVGINIEKGNESHWLVGVRPKNPELVKLAASGGIAGFSVGVLANRKEV